MKVCWIASPFLITHQQQRSWPAAIFGSNAPCNGCPRLKLS